MCVHMCPHHIPEVAQRELLEDQNDQIAERLSGKMATLHNVSLLTYCLHVKAVYMLFARESCLHICM